MLRIIQNRNASGAKSYYAQPDYYTKDQELPGQWRGELAKMLGLSGTVEQSQWNRLCDNQHPLTGKQLTVRQRNDRTIGYDFNFHLPKSVSLIYGLTKDERILEAFRNAVDVTMRDIESEALTRVRRDGKDENRQTGNLLWGEFIHSTSRPVDGVPCPHLHAHCFAFNATYDAEEKRLKAGQFRELKRDASYFEAKFHSRMAESLVKQGFPVVRTRTGWEIDGFQNKTLKEFSKRTSQIEELARKQGIVDPAKKAELGAKSRAKKSKALTFDELQDNWRRRLDAADSSTLEKLSLPLHPNQPWNPIERAQASIDHAVLHAFERQSVVPERQLLALAMRRGIGETNPEAVLEAIRSVPLVRGHRDGRELVTTRQVLAEEMKLVSRAKALRGVFPSLASNHKLNRSWLNESQQNAVQRVLNSIDGITLIRGAAGVGKTTMMQEVVEAIEGRGKKVFAFAPSADASRGTLREAGFANAETVATLLASQNLQDQLKGQVIWIDEAGQIGLPTLLQVIELAENSQARLLLSGDVRQHGSVERGTALALLEEEAGLKPAEVTEIKRQSGLYKVAVRQLSEGSIAEGFDQLDRMGWIQEVADDERYLRMAQDYVASCQRGESCLVVSPTHAEGDRITVEIRQLLLANGRLKGESHTFTTLDNCGLTEAERGDFVNLQEGDVLQFHQNAKGFQRGDRLVVTGLTQAPLQLAKRYQVFRPKKLEVAAGERLRITHNGFTADGVHRLNNGTLYTVGGFTDNGDIVLRENGWVVSKDYGHFDHGYVVTSYASQGKSVDRVLIGQSSWSYAASSREQFYVSVSRGKREATIYTDDKQGLREAIDVSEQKLSATEFVRESIRIGRLKVEEQNHVLEQQHEQERRRYG